MRCSSWFGGQQHTAAETWCQMAASFGRTGSRLSHGRRRAVVVCLDLRQLLLDGLADGAPGIRHRRAFGLHAFALLGELTQHRLALFLLVRQERVAEVRDVGRRYLARCDVSRGEAEEGALVVSGLHRAKLEPSRPPVTIVDPDVVA